MLQVVDFVGSPEIEQSLTRQAYPDTHGVTPQGKNFMQFGHSHPFLVLFAARAGLLYWTPLMWMGFFGMAITIARPALRPLAIALVPWVMLEVYLNSSAMDWFGGRTFGQRRLTTLAGPFVVLTAIALEAAWQWISASPRRLAWTSALGWLGPALFIGVGAWGTTFAKQVEGESAVRAPDLYGGAFRHGLQAIYDLMGNPFIAPASFVFSLRYGVHPRTFDSVAVEGFLVHNHRLEHVGPSTLRFAKIADEWIASGMRRDANGVILEPRVQGRFLCPLAWPYVTSVSIEAARETPAPVTLRIRSGSFFGRREVATVTIPRGGGPIGVPVAPGMFDSGINEIILESDTQVTLSSWTWLDQTPHAFAVY